ncbi:MAG: tetratricopeptide repeat protein [Endomicrobium sp.]|jgi:tetratricopeptide (TPR) repeat protein|nr:tetratricopeptide repeat protein [Endomicrobium sp.]
MRGVSYAVKESKAEKLVNFIAKQIKENKTRFVTVICFAAGILFFTIFFYIRWQSLDYSASDRVSAAYMFFSMGDKARGIESLNTAVLSFPNAPASYQARLALSDFLIEEKKYDEALPLLQRTYEKGKPAAFKPLGLFRMIYLYGSKKDYDNAVFYSTEFIKNFSGSYLIKDVYINLAQFYELKNSPQDAKRVYSEILSNFPATNEAAKADEALKGL